MKREYLYTFVARCGVAMCLTVLLSSCDTRTSLGKTFEAVDLGLPSGLKWATWNIGAKSSSDYGAYFAWGETATKEDYNLASYKYYLSPSNDKQGIGVYTEGHTKYCDRCEAGCNGYTDSLTILEPTDDVAHVLLGGAWRMPTIGDFEELSKNCVWTWTTMPNGVSGYNVKGKNGNSIFLPAAGYRYEHFRYCEISNGFYWSSSLSSTNVCNARYLGFFSGNVSVGYIHFRDYGFSVRPVWSKE
ncbi:MAG: hypothetical protein IKR17_10340 [Bacteroidales bacterium]|nr:hypothetical protein [Bacteroidales bacterium]